MRFWCGAHLLDNFKSTHFHGFPYCLSLLPSEHSTAWLLLSDPCHDERMAISRFYLKASEKAPPIFFRHIFIHPKREGRISLLCHSGFFFTFAFIKESYTMTGLSPVGATLPGKCAVPWRRCVCVQGVQREIAGTLLVLYWEPCSTLDVTHLVADGFP